MLDHLALVHSRPTFSCLDRFPLGFQTHVLPVSLAKVHQLIEAEGEAITPVCGKFLPSKKERIELVSPNDGALDPQGNTDISRSKPGIIYIKLGRIQGSFQFPP